MIEVLNYTNIQKRAISMKMFSPIRMITAVFFLIGAALGAPAPVSDAGLSVGQTAYAAQVSAKEQSPSYWQMYYNFAPPTDEFSRSCRRSSIQHKSPDRITNRMESSLLREMDLVEENEAA